MGLQVRSAAPPSFAALQSQFLTERRYLKNLTPRSIGWYASVFRLYATLADNATTLPTKPRLHAFVLTLRERGVRPVTVNSYRTAINALCHWLHQEGHIAESLSMPHLKMDQRVLTVLTEDHVRALLKTKPTRFTQWRLHALVSVIIDTALRIDEALGLRWQDVNLESVLLKETGKERKERLVPCSFELRKVLWLYTKQRSADPAAYVFPAEAGHRWGQRNSQRHRERHQQLG